MWSDGRSLFNKKVETKVSGKSFDSVVSLKYLHELQPNSWLH